MDKMKLATNKKIVAGMLALSLLFTISGCRADNKQESQAVATDQVAQQDDQAPAETDNGNEAQTPVKNTYTEEEKAVIESQEGVTVDDNGVIQVDVSDMFE